MNALSPSRVALSALLLLLVAAGCGPGIADSPEDDGLEATSNAIVGGSTDNGHSAVALLYQDPGYICSGTLIDKRVYLTAAHCIESLNPNDYVVVGGTEPFNQNVEPDYFSGVESVHIHPQYDPQNTFNDVGIVILDSDAPVKPYRWLNDAGNTYSRSATATPAAPSTTPARSERRSSTSSRPTRTSTSTGTAPRTRASATRAVRTS